MYIYLYIYLSIYLSIYLYIHTYIHTYIFVICDKHTQADTRWWPPCLSVSVIIVAPAHDGPIRRHRARVLVNIGQKARVSFKPFEIPVTLRTALPPAILPCWTSLAWRLPLSAHRSVQVALFIQESARAREPVRVCVCACACVCVSISISISIYIYIIYIYIYIYIHT